MTEVFLGSFGAGLGEARDLVELTDEIGAATVERLLAGGLRSYRAADVRPWELATRAVHDTVRELPDGAVDLVLYVTDTLSWDDFHSFDPSRFLRACGLPRAQLVGVGLNGCANAGQAVRTASAYLRSGAARTAVIVCTDVAAPGRRLLSNGAAVLSDGAASCLVGTAPAGPGYRLHGTAVAVDAWLCDADPVRDVLAVLKVTADGVRRAARDVRASTGLRGADVDHLVTNNYTRSVSRTLASLAGVPVERLYTELVPSVGHCFSADFLLNLSRLRDTGAAAPGERVLVLDTGHNVWGLTALEVV